MCYDYARMLKDIEMLTDNDKICVKLHRKADDGNGIFRV